MKRVFYLKLGLSTLLILNFLNALAPLLSATHWPATQWLGAAIYFLLDPACHQQPQRSFFIHGLPMALCVRCTFIYLGMAGGVALALVKKNVRLPDVVYVAVLLFVVLEIGTEMLGFYSNFKLLRSVSGFVSGVALMIFLLSTKAGQVFRKEMQ